MKAKQKHEKPFCTREQADALLAALLENYRALAGRERDQVRETFDRLAMDTRQPAPASQAFAAAAR